MTRRPSRRLVFALSILVGSLLLTWPLARWSRSRSQRTEAVRIAARAYLEQFNEPAPPYRKLPPGVAAHLSVRWQPSRNAYIVDFGYQYVDDATRRGILGDPVPFSSFTAIESFEVVPGGGCVYSGHHSAGPY